MTNRRKFLLNGSMAATALLTVKPFTSLANRLSPVTGFSMNNNTLTLAHTGNAMAGDHGQVLRNISKLKNSSPNLIMLHAGEVSPVTNPVYDASLHAGVSSYVAANDYKIIYKGDIKTGIITADQATASAENINALAVYLKEEKNCRLVICLSQLGYKVANGLDDLELAAASTHLDVIIGGHAANFCKSPVIARNKLKGEVIINHAADQSLALRKIEIGFDESGRKNRVSFSKSIQQA